MSIARNHTGHRIGECHQHAKVPDAVVREIKRRNVEGEGYVILSRATGIPVFTIRDWCTGRTRASA